MLLAYMLLAFMLLAYMLLAHMLFPKHIKVIGKRDQPDELKREFYIKGCSGTCSNSCLPLKSCGPSRLALFMAVSLSLCMCVFVCEFVRILLFFCVVCLCV